MKAYHINSGKQASTPVDDTSYRPSYRSDFDTKETASISHFQSTKGSDSLPLQGIPPDSEAGARIAYSRFLGYKKGANGRPEIVPHEAEIVRTIYQMFLDGKTIRHIADWLTQKEIPTPAGKSKWSVSTVRSILSNEKYKGDALLQKSYTVDYLTKEVRKNNGEVKQYLVENSHEAIIEPETFDLVQERLKKRSTHHNRVSGNSAWSNKLICSDCGGFYGHKVWHNYNNTKRYDVWYCNQKYTNEEKCQTPVIRQGELEEALLKALSKAGHNNMEYSDTLWNEYVDYVMVYPEPLLDFHLTDGSEVKVTLAR